MKRINIKELIQLVKDDQREGYDPEDKDLLQEFEEDWEDVETLEDLYAALDWSGYEDPAEYILRLIIK